MKKYLNKIFRNFGYEFKRLSNKTISPNKKLAEGYPEYLREAEKQGIDVNDYINNKFANPEYDLGIVFFPELKKFQNPVVCELGVGTGRWTRVIINELKKHDSWKILLVDHSEWLIDFLKKYFEKEKNVSAHLNNGLKLPFEDREFIDLIFCQGVFVEINLQVIASYCREFNRTLKKGGIAIFNYIDINSQKGWEHMIKQSDILKSCYTYHSSEIIDKLFTESGFLKIKSILLGNSTYAFFQKSD